MTVRLENVKITVVTEAFKQTVGDIVAKKVLMQEAKLGSLPASDPYERQNREMLAKNVRVAKFLLTERGQDRMITALKRMKFEKFYCTKAPSGEVFLCGKTLDMILNLKGTSYNVGPYHICIGESAILGTSLDQVHMFPDRKPLAYNRHLHHGTRNHDFKHPLMAVTSTCWGNVGSSFVSAKNEADIADMFRVLFIYVSRLNYSSPLRSSWHWEVVNEYGVPA